VPRPLALHLNGAPGVGKSTLAARWAAAHPGTWLLDVDALRTWVSGWRDDFTATGALARPVALAMLGAAAGSGQDVVLPQLLADPAERDRFRAAAEAGGAQWVEVVLVAGVSETAARLGARSADQPWLQAVHDVLDAAGQELVSTYADRVAALVAATPDAVLLDTRGLGVEASYDALVAAVGQVRKR
jgi:predicted kinase